MAEEKIRFAIDSTFAGEGFTKATKATEKASKDVTGLGLSLSSLAQQFGLLDGPIGKFVNGAVSAGRAISGLAKSSTALKAALSPIGLAIAGVTAAVGGAVASFKMIHDRMRENEEAAKTNVTSFEQLMGAYNRLQKSIEGARRIALEKEYAPRIEQAKAEAKAVDEVAKAYAALAAAESAVNSAKGDLKIAQLTNEFNDKLRKAADELEKGVIVAQRELALAQARGAQAVDKAADAAEEQRQTLISLNQKIAAQTALVENLTAAGKDAEKEQTSLNSLLNARQVQEKKVEAADLALETARLKAAEDEAAQSAALKQLEKATNDEREARKEAAQAVREELDARAAMEPALKTELADKQSEAAATQKRIETYEDYAKQVAAAVEQMKDDIKTGVAKDLEVHQGISGGGYDYSLGADGTPDNFIDWQRARRYGERADRDAERTARRNDSADRRYSDLADKMGRGGKLSDSERAFMDDYEQYVAGKNAADFDPIVQGIIGSQKKTLSDLHTEMDEIKTKLNNLGLK